MSITVEQLLRGQQFYTGVRIASGVLSIAIAAYFLSGFSLPIVARVIAGAICISVADVPSPKKHKRRELLITLCLAITVYIIIATVRHWPIALAISIFIIGFVVAFSAIYGKKSGPVTFSAIFGMIMALGGSSTTEAAALHSAALFGVGGASYMFYAIIAGRFLSYRTRQQLFAECSFELAQYLRIKASLYEKNAKLDELYPALVNQQALVVEKQQNAMDYIFREIKTDKDTRIAQLLIRQIDFFEYIMASNTDYEKLQLHYSGSDIMLFLRDLVSKCAKMVDGVAYTALRGTTTTYTVNFKAEIFAIEYELERMSYDKRQNIAALTMLIDAYEKVILCTEKTDILQKIQRAPIKSHQNDITVDFSPFLTRPEYNLSVIKDNLKLDSYFFRYALRAALAMECGFAAIYLMVALLPGYVHYSYWILITISVVLRSSYSLTRQRRTDRIVGNIIGCFLAALLLYTTPNYFVLLVCLYISMVIVNSFGTINYRMASVAASVMVFSQLYFMNPDLSFALGERVADTIVGSLIAYVFSFVFPNWEYLNLTGKLLDLSKANDRYMAAVLDLSTTSESFRIARKDLLDNTTAMSRAFERMLDEPKGKHRAVGDVGRFITLSYLLAARTTAIRVLMERLAQSPARPFIEADLAEIREEAHRLMSFKISTNKKNIDKECIVPLEVGETAPIQPLTATGDHYPNEPVGKRQEQSEKQPENKSTNQSAKEAELAVPDTFTQALKSMQNIDYVEQNTTALLKKQMDAALTLAIELRKLSGNITKHCAR